jgi:hypothetical protein
MPKKEKMWTMGNKGPTGPWVWHTWVKGSKKPVRVVAFDVDHIRCQLEGKQVIKVKRLPEEKSEFSSMPLGPKGCTVNQPADYDKGFKILKAWLDTQEGPPESVRQELRELFIDYDRAKSKTTRSSTKKKLRHKI